MLREKARARKRARRASGALRRGSIDRPRAGGPWIRVRFFPSPGDGTGRRNGGNRSATSTKLCPVPTRPSGKQAGERSRVPSSGTSAGPRQPRPRVGGAAPGSPGATPARGRSTASPDMAATAPRAARESPGPQKGPTRLWRVAARSHGPPPSRRSLISRPLVSSPGDGTGRRNRREPERIVDEALRTLPGQAPSRNSGSSHPSGASR